MSGEVQAHGVTHTQPLQYGPRPQRLDEPFTPRQLARIDDALTLSSRETGLDFSVYVGGLDSPTRAHAEALFEKLGDNSVLLAVSPGQRVLHIVTGPGSAPRVPNRACALAALAMRGQFTSGELTAGIVAGLRMLADSAGTA